jgi:PAS domain S-box-containing protein
MGHRLLPLRAVPLPEGQGRTLEVRKNYEIAFPTAEEAAKAAAKESTSPEESAIVEAARVADTEGLMGLAPEEWRVLWNRSRVGIAALAPDGTLELVNPRLAEWLGYEPGELVGKKLEQITTHAGEDSDRSAELVARGEIDTYQARRAYLARNGSKLDVIVTVHGIYDAARLKRFVATYRQVVSPEEMRAADKSPLLMRILRGNEKLIAGWIVAAIVAIWAYFTKIEVALENQRRLEAQVEQLLTEVKE